MNDKEKIELYENALTRIAIHGDVSDNPAHPYHLRPMLIGDAAKIAEDAVRSTRPAPPSAPKKLTVEVFKDAPEWVKFITTDGSGKLEGWSARPHRAYRDYVQVKWVIDLGEPFLGREYAPTSPMFEPWAIVERPASDLAIYRRGLSEYLRFAKSSLGQIKTKYDAGLINGYEAALAYVEGRDAKLCKAPQGETPVIDPDTVPAGTFEFEGKTLKFPKFSMTETIARFKSKRYICQLNCCPFCGVGCGTACLLNVSTNEADARIIVDYDFHLRALIAFCAARGIKLEAAIPEWLKVGGFAICDGKAVKILSIANGVVDSRTRDGHKIGGEITQFKKAKVRPWTVEEAKAYVGKPLNTPNGTTIILLGIDVNGDAILPADLRVGNTMARPLLRLCERGELCDGWPCGEVVAAN